MQLAKLAKLAKPTAAALLTFFPVPTAAAAAPTTATATNKIKSCKKMVWPANNNNYSNNSNDNESSKQMATKMAHFKPSTWLIQVRVVVVVAVAASPLQQVFI